MHYIEHMVGYELNNCGAFNPVSTTNITDCGVMLVDDTGN